MEILAYLEVEKINKVLIKEVKNSMEKFQHLEEMD